MSWLQHLNFTFEPSKRCKVSPGLRYDRVFVLCDFSLVLNPMSHKILLNILVELSFNSNALSFIHSYLLNRYLIIYATNCTPQCYTCGIGQVCSPGPTIFSVIIPKNHNDTTFEYALLLRKWFQRAPNLHAAWVTRKRGTNNYRLKSPGYQRKRSRFILNLVKPQPVLFALMHSLRIIERMDIGTQHRSWQPSWPTIIYNKKSWCLHQRRFFVKRTYMLIK